MCPLATGLFTRSKAMAYNRGNICLSLTALLELSIK